MAKYLCIHGHFYQPPREDPWLDEVLPEASAAPSRDWNVRISRESYAPLAWSRRLDGQGRIIELFNAYEYISFNAGPTLMKWMADNAPEAYGRMLDGDRAAVARLGHGNALAQVCHHVIMPLASELDKELETAWAIEDFRARFDRDPEGMWLPEAAVDVPTLEVLAAQGIAFVVLAPRQAASVADDNGEWRDVSEWDLDICEPYRVDLPSGRSVAAYFYNGPISSAVAFERLLENGDEFWRRITAEHHDGLLSLATDGETYGHHFKFGEMALAHVLTLGREGRDGFELINFAAHLAAHPPRRRVRLHEPSSWSCYHGVERWRTDCGCSTGGHPGWNQRWRAPLREALDKVRSGLDAHYFAKGAELFQDSRAALLDYGRVLAGTVTPEAFGTIHLRPGLDSDGRTRAFKLLAMQEWGVAAFASCAWFFDDIARIEPMNAMTFALRAMDLAKETGGPDLVADFASVLSRAVSNDPAQGNGQDIFLREILPRRGTPVSLTAQALLTLLATDTLPEAGGQARLAWPGVSISLTIEKATSTRITGRCALSWRNVPGEDIHTFVLKRKPHAPLTDAVLTLAQSRDSSQDPPRDVSGLDRETIYACRGLPENKVRFLAEAYAHGVADRLWELRLRSALTGASLFTPWREGQEDQLAAPDLQILWPPLAWAWVTGHIGEHRGGPEGRDWSGLLAFLSKYRPGHSELPMLRSRLVAAVLAGLAAPSPDWTGLVSIVDRAAELGLDVDWWEIRNRLWECGFASSGARMLGRTLGFAV